MTVNVPSPVHYKQIADGPIRDSAGRALIEGTTTQIAVARLMDTAQAYALVTGSVGVTHKDTVFGVTIEAEWLRAAPVEDDDEDERDIEFNLDTVVETLHAAGIRAYVEQTGGGCATIYAGGLHAHIDGGEADVRYDVAAGPGNYGWGHGPSTALLAEFYVGSNDDGVAGDAEGLPDTITTASDAIKWAADTILKAVIATETRTFAEWNKRPCKHCKEVVYPGPRGTWETFDRVPCEADDATDGAHDAY